MKISGTKTKLDVELDIEELLHLVVPLPGPKKIGELMIDAVRHLVQAKVKIDPPAITAIAFNSKSITVRFMEKIEDAADFPIWPDGSMNTPIGV